MVTPAVSMISRRQADGDIASPGVFKDMDLVRVFVNEQVFAVDTQGSRIVSVVSRNAVTGRDTRFAAPVFVDCTGKAQLGLLAGASTVGGRESTATYGESLASEEADTMHHGHTVLFRTELAAEPVDFPPVP